MQTFSISHTDIKDAAGNTVWAVYCHDHNLKSRHPIYYSSSVTMCEAKLARIKARQMNITKSGPYELTFWGGTRETYRRTHLTLASAEREAKRVLADMNDRNAHPAVIYEDGKSQPVATVR